MVLESRLAELLQGQAKKFINGFNAEHLNLGLLSGFLELRNLALNPEPLDELFLGSDLPFVVKAGTLSSAMLQLSLMQGELEILIDGLTLVVAPACKWLTREEVYQHRTNEMERLEFVHMRSQSQRRNLEREMFRKLFSDYLSRIKITVKNVHVRLEVEDELSSLGAGPTWSLGLIINSCDVTPVAPTPDTTSAKSEAQSELLLAERVQLKGLLLYQEEAAVTGAAKTAVPWNLYQSTRGCELGIFQKFPQDQFIHMMDRTRQAHLAVPASQLLLPSTDVSIKVDLKSQSLFTDCHVENCLTLEVVICLQNPSRLRVTAGIVEGMRWLVRRALDFQMWPFLHALHGKPANGLGRWHVLRSFIHLKRRIQGNAYNLHDAIRMRMNCKEYIRLYKKKFNGPQSSFHWRKALPPLTAEDATRLGLIELSYPADKLVNFRMMAQTEMKTETSINSFAEEGALGDVKRSPRSQVWQVRELTPMEQLHLHGQHGFGANIFRGLPPPPSNLKVRIDVVAPLGLWWVCKLGGLEESSWTAVLDSGRQPVRLLLVDSISDNSVFGTLEVPRTFSSTTRPVAVLLARNEAAFQHGPAQGASGAEWCSMLEFDGDLCCWCQVKTVPMTASHSPWDLFGSFSCGKTSPKRNDQSFGRVTPLDEVLSEQGFHRPQGEGAVEPTLRINLPLQLPSGQEGPFVALLRWSLATPNGGCVLGSLANLVRSGYELAALRLHMSLPPVVLQGVNCADAPLRLPPFDAAVHFENGGLVDGFVVGLHNLYNFANLVASMPDVKRRKAANSVPTSSARRQMTNVQPLSLQPLEQAPPLLLTCGAFLAASAVVLAGGRRKACSTFGERVGEGKDFTKMAEEHGLLGIAQATASSAGSTSMAGITLIPTLLAVLLGRRALYERLRATAHAADPHEVFQFFAATLHVLLAMGFPLHRCALPLAAWVGSVELLQVLSRGCKDSLAAGPAGGTRGGGNSDLQMLMSWAARGVYANPCREGQVQVLQWLMAQKGDPNQRDSAGRSVLDWACWAGSEELASLLLRRRPPFPCRGAGAAASVACPPLLLATASRSTRLVKLLLDATGDPHATPTSSESGHGCGALMLAVRCCEFELASQVLQSAAYLNVDFALGESRRGSHRFADEGLQPGLTTRATIVLVESFRRFASGLQRLSAEEVSVAALRQHLPGPHPDENLYATSIMPLGDVLHPLAARLTSPMHWVPLELRPCKMPMQWLKRGGDPWAPARLMVECLLQRGFRPDEAFLNKVNLALPAEVRSLTRRLAGETAGPPVMPLPTLLAEMMPERRMTLPKITAFKDMYSMPMVPLNGQLKNPGINGTCQELPKTVNEEGDELRLPKAMEYLKDLSPSPSEASSRPAIRVVVLGAPRVGKSSVTKVLAEYLDMNYVVEDEGPTRLRVVRGSWPSSNPVVEVLLWDTVSAVLPELVTDSCAALFAVAVLDGDSSADVDGPHAESMALRCVSDDFSAPRRALIVENCFSELSARPGARPERPESHGRELQRVQCNLLQEEGRSLLKKSFGKLLAEMVGQIEARQEASTLEGEESVSTPCGEGDFRQVLLRDPIGLPNISPSKPLGARVHASYLRGSSSWVDPTAASLAWRALHAARSSLAEVHPLTGTSPPSSSSLAFSTLNLEALGKTLALSESGAAGQNLSVTLRRVLMEMNLIYPLAADEKEMVLVPDFAERVSVSPLLQQLMDESMRRPPHRRAIFFRLNWRSTRSSVAMPSLRRTFRRLLSQLASTSWLLRGFALIEESPEARNLEELPDLSDLQPGFVLAFGDGDARDAHAVGLSELVAEKSMTFVLVTVGREHWDVLCSGPQAAWAWRAFAAHLPTFHRLSAPATASTTAPRHVLHAAGHGHERVQLTSEDLSSIAWLFSGPQAKDLRERLVLESDRRSLGSCFGQLCGSISSDFEEPAEEFEVRLLMRRWRELAYFLTQALQSPHSRWLISCSLRRFARDYDALGARCHNGHGEASRLPLLRLQGSEVFCFDVDHDSASPERDRIASADDDAATPVLAPGRAVLAAAEVTPAVQMWMNICLPLALWTEERAEVAKAVAKALQRAATLAFSEAMNWELRRLLRAKAQAELSEVTEI